MFISERMHSITCTKGWQRIVFVQWTNLQYDLGQSIDFEWSKVLPARQVRDDTRNGEPWSAPLKVWSEGEGGILVSVLTDHTILVKEKFIIILR